MSSKLSNGSENYADEDYSVAAGTRKITTVADTLQNCQPITEGIDEVFNGGVFLTQLFYHVCWPYSLAVLIPLDGLLLAKNIIFLPLSSAFFVLTFPLALILQGGIVLLIVYPFTRSMAESWMLVAMLLAHRFIVATKYGLMPSKDYERLKTTRLSASAFSRTNLITAWREPSPECCDHQLRISQTRLGFDSEQLYMFFAKTELAKLESENRPLKRRSSAYNRNRDRIGGPMDESDDMSSDRSSPERPTMERVCTTDLAHHIIQEIIVGNKGMHNIQPVAGVMATVLMLVPIACRVALDPREAFGDAPEGQEWVGYLIVLAGFIVTFPTFAILAFVMIGKLDYYRRYASLSIMNFIIDPHPIADNQLKRIGYPEQPPILDMTIPSNISAWLTMRELIVNFGAIFQARVACYTGYLVLAVTAMLVRLIYSVVVYPENMFNSSNLQFMVVVIYLTIFLIIEVGFMAYYGHMANKQSLETTRSLLRLSMIVQEVMSIDDEHKVDAGQTKLTAQEALMTMKVLSDKFASLERMTMGMEASIPSSVSTVASIKKPARKPALERAHTKLRTLRAGGMEKEIPRDRLERASAMLGRAARSVEANDLARPVSILGLRLDITIITRFFAAFGSALGFIASRLLA